MGGGQPTVCVCVCVCVCVVCVCECVCVVCACLSLTLHEVRDSLGPGAVERGSVQRAADHLGSRSGQELRGTSILPMCNFSPAVLSLLRRGTRAPIALLHAADRVLHPVIYFPTWIPTSVDVAYLQLSTRVRVSDKRAIYRR